MADYEFLEKSLGRKASYSFNVDQLPKPFIKPTLMLTGRQDSAVGYSDLWKIIENYPRASFKEHYESLIGGIPSVFSSRSFELYFETEAIDETKRNLKHQGAAFSMKSRSSLGDKES